MSARKIHSPYHISVLFLTVSLLFSSVALAIPGAKGLDVDTIISDPHAYNGEITVRGGVMSVDPDNKQFQVIDYREYKGCGVVTCALKSLTVKSPSKLPAVKDVVEIKGTIEKDASGNGGFALKASEVRVK